MLGSLIL